MPKATYEEGTELVLDSEAVAVGATWSEQANGCDVFRLGGFVQVALRVTPKARAAWEKKKYKKGELALEGGHVYEAGGAAKVAETDENKPTVKPTHWTDLGTEAANKIICTLPRPYWPVEVVKDASTATVEISAAGVVTALDAVTLATARVYNLAYRAAGISP